MAVEQVSQKCELPEGTVDCGDHFCVGEVPPKPGLIGLLDRFDNYLFYLNLRAGDFWEMAKRYIHQPKPDSVETVIPSEITKAPTLREKTRRQLRRLVGAERIA